MMTLAAGLALGLAASGHCAAMCGPLASGLGRRMAQPSVSAQLRHAALYHAGRIFTYLLLALPAGLAGQRAAIDGLGRALAIAAGVVLLAMAMTSSRLPFVAGISSACSSLLARVSMPVVRWAAARPVAGPVITGVLNGILPCGLVYAALTAASTTGSVSGAALLMTGFGVGTLPVLVTMTVCAAAVPAPLRLRLRPLAPLVLALTAAILILRGVTIPHHQADRPPAAAMHAHP